MAEEQCSVRCRSILWLQAVLCILICGVLIYQILDIYVIGTRTRTQVNTIAWVYTREAIAQRLVYVLPLIGMSFGVSVAGWILGIQDEHAKSSKALMHISPEKLEAPVPEIGGRVRGVLFVLAFALIVLGILNGSMRDVLVKAIKICTECVGLG